MTASAHPQRGLWALLLLGLALVVLGTAAGSQGWQAWWLAPADALSQQIVWDIRLPRSAGAWLGGCLLGLAGAVAQGLFRNPLADPYLLGSASGASLGVGVYFSLFGGSAWALGVWQSLGLTGAAFVGALLAVLLTLMLAQGVQSLRLLLAGVVVGVVLGAVTSLLSILQPAVLQAMQGFMLGSTAFVDATACLSMALSLALCVVLAGVFARVLDALTLGEATAQSLGVPLGLARLVLVGVISLATASAVAHMGLVAFVGLAAPHLVRSLVRATHVWLVLLSALMGGVLLTLADLLARVLLAPQELPVGVITAFIGGGYLLWRVHQSAGHSAAQEGMR